MFKNILFFFFCGLSVFSITGQQDSTTVKYDTAPIEVKKITDGDLQEYRNDPKFDYEITTSEIGWWQDFKTWLGNLLQRFFEWLFGVEEAAGMLSIFFRLIPYILLALLIFVLIRFFINVNSRALIYSRANDALVSLSEEAHIIKNENIQQLIQKALTDKNYRLAIRYYYLHILKLMSDKEIIKWEMQKTNDDYLNEIKNSELKRPFTKITHLYAYIWYGNFDIDESKYRMAETTFSQLQKTLQNE